MDEFRDLPQLALNLRWILRDRGRKPEQWAAELVRMMRKTITSSRAIGLLYGLAPEPAEIAVLVEQTRFDREELLGVPLYTREHSLFAQNLCHLVEAIEHGDGKRAAKVIGITDSQLSRWKKWGDERKPHRTNVRNLLKFHGMDPDLKLEEVPIFLSMEPVSGYAQKEWLSSRVQEMPASEIAKIYPALKKLFRYDEEN